MFERAVIGFFVGYTIGAIVCAALFVALINGWLA